MKGFFARLLGNRSERFGADGVLSAGLACYPANSPAHPGPASALSVAQARDNLAAFMLNRKDRLTMLTALAADSGIDLAPILDPAQDPVPSLNALTGWLRETLPPRRSLPYGSSINAPTANYIASNRAGAGIVFSLTADLALLEGEGIIGRWPDYHWDLALAPEEAGTHECRRVVLMGPLIPDLPPVIIDLEIETLWLVYALRRPDGGAGYSLGQTLTALTNR